MPKKVKAVKEEKPKKIVKKETKKELKKDLKAPKTVEKPVKKLEKGPLSEDKQEVIERFAQVKGDTGSPEVQVALLTHKIIRLTSHLDENKKDNHSRRGLLKVIAKRRRILNYLEKLDEKRYKGLIESLSLKK